MVPRECHLPVHCSPLTSGHCATSARLYQLHKHHQRHLQQCGYDPCTKGTILLLSNIFAHIADLHCITLLVGSQNQWVAYKNQSTAKMSPMSSVGRLTAWRTSIMVTKPACGIPAAPIEAAVAVKLQNNATDFNSTNNRSSYQIVKIANLSSCK